MCPVQWFLLWAPDIILRGYFLWKILNVHNLEQFNNQEENSFQWETVFPNFMHVSWTAHLHPIDGALHFRTWSPRFAFIFQSNKNYFILSSFYVLLIKNDNTKKIIWQNKLHIYKFKITRENDDIIKSQFLVLLFLKTCFRFILLLRKPPPKETALEIQKYIFTSLFIKYY